MVSPSPTKGRSMSPLTSIGPGRPAWIIAEIGVNHDGCVERAEKLVELAAKAGADAVKVQCFRADQLAVSGAPLSEYQKRAARRDVDQREMLRRHPTRTLDDVPQSIAAALETSAGQIRRKEFPERTPRGLLADDMSE